MKLGPNDVIKSGDIYHDPNTSWTITNGWVNRFPKELAGYDMGFCWVERPDTRWHFDFTVENISREQADALVCAFDYMCKALGATRGGGVEEAENESPS